MGKANRRELRVVPAPGKLRPRPIVENSARLWYQYSADPMCTFNLRGASTLQVLSLVFAAGLTAALFGCGGSGGNGGGGGGSSSGGGGGVINPPPPVPGMLTSSDVTAVVTAAAQAAQADDMVIAVVDRMGRILAIYHEPSAPATMPGNFGNPVPSDDLAVALARTAAFFSNDEAPLTSRTVRFISGTHFPPGVENTPNGALYGIENTNRGCNLSTSIDSTVPPATPVSGIAPGYGIITGKADTSDTDQMAVNPGGVPIFKNAEVVGGIGVAVADSASYNLAEFIAFSGANADPPVIGFPTFPAPGEVVIDGIALPGVDQTTAPAGTVAGTFNSSFFRAGFGPMNGTPDPDGDLIPAKDGQILTAAQVSQIVNNAVNTALQTRALIRLPPDVNAEMSIAVSDLDGTLLALHRMPDGTIFSIDVAASKARNVVYFSGATRQAQDLNDVPIGTAVTNRTIGFGAQPFFPPGIDGSSPGPFFNLYLQDTMFPCTQGFQVPSLSWPATNQSGIVFFPGSEPLYINGQLVGGLGVSGDGVDQDDFVTAGGAVGFEAPAAIRADNIVIDGVRLPYLHFPRNPTQ